MGCNEWRTKYDGTQLQSTHCLWRWFKYKIKLKTWMIHTRQCLNVLFKCFYFTDSIPHVWITFYTVENQLFWICLSRVSMDSVILPAWTFLCIFDRFLRFGSVCKCWGLNGMLFWLPDYTRSTQTIYRNKIAICNMRISILYFLYRRYTSSSPCEWVPDTGLSSTPVLAFLLLNLGHGLEE